jgi:small multidrug resistance pump
MLPPVSPAAQGLAAEVETRHRVRMNGYAWLAIAIVAEVIGTSTLKASEGFTRLLPSLVTAVGYGIAFYCLSHSMKTVPVGVGYAIWSGVGIVLITAIAWIAFKQRLDLPALVGMGLIVTGVLVINLFSKSAGH